MTVIQHRNTEPLGGGMCYIKEIGFSENSVVNGIKLRYGNNFRLVSRKPVLVKSFFGFFRRQGWEWTFAVGNEDESSANAAGKHYSDFADQGVMATTNGGAAAKGDGLDFNEIMRRFDEVSHQISSIEKPDKGKKISRFPEQPSAGLVDEILTFNEFSPLLSEKLLPENSNFDNFNRLQIAKEFALKLLKMMRFYTIGDRFEGDNGPHVISLIGATGVGKTTTIAKIASQYTIGRKSNNCRKVQVISLDNYRIGASQQIQTYGDILQIPVKFARSFQEVSQIVQQSGKNDLIFIDTIGRNPNDSIKLAETQKILSACANCEFYLLLNSSSSYRSSKDTLHNFKSFRPSAVVLSKVDESSTIGGSLSAIVESNMAICYLTTGQRVPQDIAVANPALILEQIRTPNLEINWSEFMRQCESRYLYDHV